MTFNSAHVDRTDSGDRYRIRLWIKNLIATPTRWKRSQRTGDQLSQLNGNLLRDIGQSRIEAEFS
jgi:uncharacterized protein YjiS (DUF1127 family)